ncbi:MAG: hypothetical protein Q9P14_17105 [candidate division KSB1 bacterium]|nr:hypothetical protein [candidate division KSB1 bacterium]
MKRILQFLGIFIVVLAAVLIMNTMRFQSRQPEVTPVADVVLDEDALARHLARRTDHSDRFLPGFGPVRCRCV